jgi:selenocysteine-specific elongation factor
LGYAFLTDQIAFIDVPGHERFIKNMVAGVATVDFAFLIVAADDGIMPQTREHFDILRLLGIEDGIVAITKCDLAEEDWIDLVEEEILEMVQGSFLEGKSIVRVDSLSGRGIERVREELVLLAGRKREQAPGSFFRLPVDRVFSVKGFGTVVTGSALSGTVSIEDHLEVLPRGISVRVRGIQSQGKQQPVATAGMRVALNVPQVGVEEVTRGDLLATVGRLRPSFMLDAECRILEGSPVSLEQRQRIRMHIGTKELLARAVILDGDRIDPGGEGLVQFRLEEPIAVQRLDRYVIRRYSPQITIGGGRLLDTSPKKHRKRHEIDVVSTLKHLGEARTEILIEQILVKERVLPFEDLVTKSGLGAEVVEESVGTLGIDGKIIELDARNTRYLCSQVLYVQFKEKLVQSLKKYHVENPLRYGAKRGEITSVYKKELPDYILKHFLDLCFASLVIKSQGSDLISLYDFELKLTKKERANLKKMEADLMVGHFRPPDLSTIVASYSLDEKTVRLLLQLLVDQNKIINLDGKIYFHVNAVSEGIDLLRGVFRSASELTMSEFRTLVDTSRKYALPLLNYYDGQGYTLRRGDVRVPGAKI